MIKQRAARKLGTLSQGEQSTTGQNPNNFENGDPAVKSIKSTSPAHTAISPGNKQSVNISGSVPGTKKIEKNSHEMIQKAVMRIAFYPVVPLVTALPLALTISIADLAKMWEFCLFSSIMSNLQVLLFYFHYFFDPAVSIAQETYRKYLTEKYVLKHHPILPDGQRSKVYVGTEKPSLMYTFAKYICSRKKDFIVESTKKGGITKRYTAPEKSKKATAEMDDIEHIDAPLKNANYQSVSSSEYKPEIISGPTESMTASVAQTDNFDATQTNYDQIEIELRNELDLLSDDDDEIDE